MYFEEFNVANSTEEKPRILLTGRNYPEVMSNLGLDEKDLKGKKVLSVGEGLSDFILTTNEQHICDGKAIDPVYRLISMSKNTTALEKLCQRNNIFFLSPENIIRMHSIKTVIGKTHFPFSSFDHVSFFRNGEFDLIVFSVVCATDDDGELQAKIVENLDEILRVLNPNGVINFGAFSLGSNPKLKRSVSALANRVGDVRIFSSKFKGKLGTSLLITKGAEPRLINVENNTEIT